MSEVVELQERLTRLVHEIHLEWIGAFVRITDLTFCETLNPYDLTFCETLNPYGKVVKLLPNAETRGNSYDSHYTTFYHQIVNGRTLNPHILEWCLEEKGSVDTVVQGFKDHLYLVLHPEVIGIESLTPTSWACMLDVKISSLEEWLATCPCQKTGLRLYLRLDV